MYLSRRGFYLPKSFNDILKIQKKLTVTPLVNPEFDLSVTGPVTFSVYQENDTHLILPRSFGIKQFNKNEYENQIKIENNRTFTFNGSLRDYQQNIVDIVIPKIKEQYGGLISIPTGRGKTIIAVKLACQLQLKTLFIVHKTFFLEQTKEKFELFSNAKIGILQQKTIDVDNKDVVIGMLQSILSRDYGDEIMNQFDLVIFDECHHISSKEFSKIFNKIRPVYTIGLSATPKRKDGLDKVFEYYAGPMLYQEHASTKHIIEVKTISFDIIHPKFKNVKNKSGQVLLPIIVNNLVSLDQRNKLIIKEIIDLKMEEPERKFLILGGRREHLFDISNEIIKQKTYLKEEIGFYMGGMKKNELKDASEKSMIFATFEMASEGLDILALDTLFMITPKGDVNQAVGRILRKQAGEYEFPPKIIDIIDEIESVKRLGNKRIKLYKERGYIINGVNSREESKPKEDINVEIEINKNINIEIEINGKMESLTINKETNEFIEENNKKILKKEKVNFNKSLF
jgi:superfamily II DNA or RNA helicase